ncbi:MAG: hypothetical protein INH41_26305 [Myxococcaceae bacterium]|nr:hypothetical protein [Myxococcaceae bacterium]MCA3015912.1 hypothetical protein [Myxococcaceae bacterium]
MGRDSAACVDGRLVVSQPVEPTTLPAAQPVSVEAQFVLADGGPWPSTLAIPVRATWGAQTLLLSGIPGALQGFSDAGSGAVAFGWDGGPTASRAVSFSACASEVAAACLPFQECEPSPAGGACVSQGFVLEWTTPAAGASTNQASVPAELRVSKPDGGAVSLTSVPVSGAADFTGAAGRYSGALPVAAPDGVKAFVAGWPDGGPSRELAIERDTVAPEVTVFVAPRSGPDPDPVIPSAWKKDERVLVRVTVDGGRPAVPGDVLPPPEAVVAPETCTGCTGACRCFAIDVTSSPLNGLRGPMGFRVLPIEDPAGNRAEPRDGGFAVTRLRWSRSAALSRAPGVTLSVYPLTISENGTVVMGLAQMSPSPSFPSVLAFDPSGNLLWSALTTQAVLAPIVAAGNSIWVSTAACPTSSCPASGSRSLSRLSLADGGLVESRCTSSDLTDAVVSLGLGGLGNGPALPVGVTANNALEFGSPTCVKRAFPGPAAPSHLIPIALRSAGARLELFTSIGSVLRKQECDGTAWSLVAERPGLTTLSARGLALDGAGRLVAAGAPAAFFTGSTFFFSDSNRFDGGVSIDEPSMSSVPLVGADAIYGVSNSGSLMKIPFTATGVADAGFAGGGGFGSSWQSLILGNGRLLAVAQVGVGVPGPGNLFVRRIAQVRPSDLSIEWFADLDGLPLSGLNGALAEPALDVLRLDGGARDCSREAGVLYVLSALGPTATLTSVVVDARGLDPSAPWPKFQRDNANSANASSSTAPWTCP